MGKRKLASRWRSVALLLFGAACAKATSPEGHDRNTAPPAAMPATMDGGGRDVTPVAAAPMLMPSCAAPPATPPSDDRCDVTPRLIVSADDFPRPPLAAAVGVSSIVPSAPDLYYSLYAIDNSGIYLSAPLLRIALSGGDATVLASDAWYSGRLRLPGHIIVTATDTSQAGRGDAILDLPTSHEPMTTLFTLPSDDRIGNGFATDGMFVFFDGRGGIEAVPLMAAQPGTPALTLVPDAITDGLAVLGQQLFFSRPQGELQSVDLPARSDGAVTMLGRTGVAPVDLTACGNQVCWLDEVNNALEQIDPGGGAVTTLLTLTGELASAENLGFDGENFYVLGDDGANTETIARIPRAGGCAVPVVSMPRNSSQAFAVDDECLYWSNTDGIFSIVKSAAGVRQ